MWFKWAFYHYLLYFLWFWTIMMSTSEDVNNNSFCRTSCYVIRFRWEYFSTRWWQSNNVHDWRLSVAMKQLCWVWCGNVCEDHSSGLRTLVLIPVLAEWFQTRPCGAHWLHKPGIMVSLWVGTQIQGLEDFQTLSYGLWEAVARVSVLKLVAELK